MQYHFIVNPNAKSKGGRSVINIIKPIVEERIDEYEFHETVKPGDATEIAMMLTQNPLEKVVVVVGGDGTLNEVVNGLGDYSNITLAVIPMGTANDFARGIKLKKNIHKALNRIIDMENIIKINIGLAQYGKDDGLDFETHRFIVSSGIGYDARICEINNSSSAKSVFNKIKLGKLSYAYLGITQMMNSKYGDATIELDDGTDIYLKDFIFCSAHNLPYEGGGFLFAPKALGGDGYLDLCVVNNVSRLRALLLLPLALKGKHIGHAGVNVYRCKSVIFNAKKRMSVHTDGETYERQSYVKISILPKRIKLIV